MSSLKGKKNQLIRQQNSFLGWHAIYDFQMPLWETWVYSNPRGYKQRLGGENKRPLEGQG